MLLLILLRGTSVCAQTVTTVHSFSGPDGLTPGRVTLAQGRDGHLYGTSSRGGSHGLGTIFKLRTSDDVFVPIHNFSGPDGSLPNSGLALARDGNFYGTTLTGGQHDKGVLFRMTAAGVVTVLHHFGSGMDGENPISSPVVGFDDNLYGTTTTLGGAKATVYKSTSAGDLSTIFTFDSGDAESEPLQATNGTLYITSPFDAVNCGLAIRMTTSGVVKSSHSFSCVGARKTGAFLTSSLMQALDSNFYGTAQGGGTLGGGTVYRLDPANHLSLLYNFGASGDGMQPVSGLTQGTDGNLYGATASGGSPSGQAFGTLFQISLGGIYKRLYSFAKTASAPQSEPVRAPVQHTSGKFYGTTLSGGTNGMGSIYSLDMGLGPFVALVRYQGKPGSRAQILGQGFTGTTGVTFNGIAATSFSVVTDTYMTAVVPANATTGPLVVTTPTGPLTSNKVFRISK
jgi:uncharacterized repeat protein (TIGR03803 family)